MQERLLCCQLLKVSPTILRLYDVRHVRCVDPANATAVQGEGVTDSAGDFTPSPVAERLISTADVRDIVENSPDSAFLIDVRATNEYNGDAPFGSGMAAVCTSDAVHLFTWA